MNFPWMSHAIAFLLGTATGAAGKYFADKFTDQRRRSELESQLKQEFANIKRRMPELIREFKNDLSKQDQKFIREFFVLHNRKETCGSEKPRLVYYEEDHKDLRSKIDILENQGFLLDMTIANTPIYRITEEFVELLDKYG